MKTTTLLSIAAAALTALAQPFGHSHHDRQHNARRAAAFAAAQKRALFTEWVTELVTVTATDYTDYTDCTTTTTTQPGTYYEASPTTLQQSTYYPATTPAPAPVFQQAVTHSSTKASTFDPLIHTSAGSVGAPAATPASAAVAAPAVVDAPAPASSSSSYSSSSGGSSSLLSFTGQVTYYTVGLGACGFDDAGKDRTDYIVALSSTLMLGSNGDPMCGKKVTLSFGGKSIIATVRDKCPSCSSQQIDLSEKAFLDLVGDLGIGRQGGVQWTLA